MRDDGVYFLFVEAFLLLATRSHILHVSGVAMFSAWVDPPCSVEQLVIVNPSGC